MRIVLVPIEEATEEDIDEIKNQFNLNTLKNTVIESCPSGGIINQVLKKNSNSDFDVSWTSMDLDFKAGGADFNTSEHKIGKKWIDGKDVYEITIKKTYTPKASATDVIYTINSFDVLINSFGSFLTTKSGAENYYPLNTPRTANASNNVNTLGTIVGTDGRVKIINGNSQEWIGGTATIYLTLQYTKK